MADDKSLGLTVEKIRLAQAVLAAPPEVVWRLDEAILGAEAWPLLALRAETPLDTEP